MQHEEEDIALDLVKRPSTPDVSLRILVPASRTGSIIGKVGGYVCLVLNEPCVRVLRGCGVQGGEHIQSLRLETGAKIKIANTMPGCEERAVHISSPER